MDEYISVEEAARRLCVNRQAVYRWVNKGKLRGVKLAGSMWRIKEDDFEEFVRSCWEETDEHVRQLQKAV